MTGTGTTRQLAAAAGAAAGTGAAQIGLGSGLGVLTWSATPGADNIGRLGSLGWAIWITAGATVFGAVIARALTSPERPSVPRRAALALSAAVGSLLTVALIALPARATLPTDRTPVTYALAGTMIGIFLAYWAVSVRPVAANLIATAGWLWALVVAAVAAELVAHHPSDTYLNSWQFAEPGLTYGLISWPSALLTLLAALLLGAVTAWPAVRRGTAGIGAAASGAAGPLAVAVTFLVLSPRLPSSTGPVQSAYLVAPYAVLAGLAGSALIVAAGMRARRTPGSAPDAAGPPGGDRDDGLAGRVRGASRGRRRATDAASGGTADGEPEDAPKTRSRGAKDTRLEDARSRATTDARSPDARDTGSRGTPGAGSRSDQSAGSRRARDAGPRGDQDPGPGGTPGDPPGGAAADRPTGSRKFLGFGIRRNRPADDEDDRIAAVPATPEGGNQPQSKAGKAAAPPEATKGPATATPGTGSVPMAAPTGGNTGVGRTGAGGANSTSPVFAPPPPPGAAAPPHVPAQGQGPAGRADESSKAAARRRGGKSTVTPPPDDPPVADINRPNRGPGGRPGTP